jgi:hypothetical protein
MSFVWRLLDPLPAKTAFKPAAKKAAEAEWARAGAKAAEERQKENQ